MLNEPTAVEQKLKLSETKRALLKMQLRGPLTAATGIETIAQRPAGSAPLSFSQQRLWFLKQLDSGNVAYNIPTALHLTGELNIPVLTQAVNEIIRRHESLRTTVEVSDGEATQKIAPELHIEIGLQDLNSLPETAQKAEILRRAREDGAYLFDLSSGPLLRVNLLSLGSQDYVLLFTLHHIIFDGWSAAILFEEFATLYRALLENKPAALPPLPIQYADFAYWQRQWLQGERLEKHLAYWRKQLEGVPALLELPTDYPRPATQSGHGATYEFRIPGELVERLQALSRKQGVTLFATLISAFNVLLHRYSGQSDFCLGASVANRSRPEFETLIGLFANMLVLRADLSGNPRFNEFLDRMQAVSLGAQEHQDLPFEKLVEELNPARDRSYSPYFQVIFILHNMPAGKWQVPGLAIRNMNVDFGSAKSDLALHITENAGFDAAFEYSTDLFEKTTMARMAEHLQTLLASLVEQPEMRVDDLPLLTQHEYRQLMAWSNTDGTSPWNGLLHERFEALAQTQPGRPAIVCGEQQLSYGELNRRAGQLARQLRIGGVGPEVRVGLCAERSVEAIIGIVAILKANGTYVPLDPAAPQERVNALLIDCGASLLLTQKHLAIRLPLGIATLYLDGNASQDNQLAHHLRSLGVAPDTIVGLCVERSLEMVIGLLGILKAGGAYLPLDPDYPKERLDFMLDDAKPILLLTQARLNDCLPGHLQRIFLDRDWPEITGESALNPVNRTNPYNLAYVIYTSGSTGQPKGVAITHANTVGLLTWASIVFTAEEIAGVLASTSLCFVMVNKNRTPVQAAFL